MQCQDGPLGYSPRPSCGENPAPKVRDPVLQVSKLLEDEELPQTPENKQISDTVITGPPCMGSFSIAPLQGETTNHNERVARSHCSQGKQPEFLKCIYEETGHHSVDKMMSRALKVAYGLNRTVHCTAVSGKQHAIAVLSPKEVKFRSNTPSQHVPGK